MITRVTPALRPQDYKTYAMRSPLTTHYRRGTCAEVDCVAHTYGWITRVDERTTLGMSQAHYIRSESGRHFQEQRQPDGLTAFTFPAGQRCFTEHHVNLERDAFFYVRPGDWRLAPAPHEVYHHASAADWVDDFATHQQKLVDRIARG